MQSSLGDFYLKKALVISFIFHIGVVTVALFSPSLSWFQAKNEILLYSTTLKVDIIDLPEEMIQKVVEKYRPIEKSISVFKIKKTQEDSLKFLTKRKILQEKSKEAIERLKTHDRISKQKKAIDILKKGNKVSAGATQPTESNGKLFLDAYRSELKEKLSKNWKLPIYLLKQTDLIGKMTFYIDEQGHIIRKKISSSGDRDFDYYMNRAVEQTLPFNHTPAEIEKDLRYDGVTIYFIPKEVR